MRRGTLGIRGGGVLLALLGLPMRLLATTADDLCMPSADPCVVATPVAVNNNDVIDVGGRELRIAAGGALDVGSGTVTIAAGQLTVAANGFLRAAPVGAAGGTINVTVGGATIAGTVSAAGVPGGSVTMTVTNLLSVTGTISANALARDAIGGSVNLTAGTVTISGPITATGGLDAIGGDITIDAIGALTVGATIDASGGDGGSVDMESGANANAGDFAAQETSVIKADATNTGGFGGTVDLTATGDAVNSGRMTLNGLVSAIGRIGTTDVGGGAGGCISATADGDLNISAATARLTVDGGGPDGDGGEIELTTNVGSIDLEGVGTASSPGPESNGGSVTLDAAGSALLGGSILVTAGDGGAGDVSISSSNASVMVMKMAVIDGTSTSTGAGGSVCLESGVGAGGTHSVVVEGRIAVDGGALGGGGGTIEITGGDSVRIASTASVRAPGALGGGAGGAITISVDPGSALIEGPLLAAGGSTTGAGGIIAIDAGGRMSINAPLDARGFGIGGEIGLSSTGEVDIRNDMLASSSAGSGGLVQIVSQSDVSIGGTVSADGVLMPPASGDLTGRVEVVGCTVTVCAANSPACPGSGAGTLRATGPKGVNRVTGRDLSIILGSMRATGAGGRNEVVYDGTQDREPLITGAVMPMPVIIVDETLLPCPACGNHMTEAPETCDDGNMLDGDGCSAMCQIEAPIPGDANNDFLLSPDDLGFLVTEIFDGDGDSIGTVSGGAFQGGPGADANGDGLVTAADLTAIVRLLVSP